MVRPRTNVGRSQKLSLQLRDWPPRPKTLIGDGCTSKVSGWPPRPASQAEGILGPLQDFSTPSSPSRCWLDEDTTPAKSASSAIFESPRKQKHQLPQQQRSSSAATLPSPLGDQNTRRKPQLESLREAHVGHCSMEGCRGSTERPSLGFAKSPSPLPDTSAGQPPLPECKIPSSPPQQRQHSRDTTRPFVQNAPKFFAQIPKRRCSPGDYCTGCASFCRRSDARHTYKLGECKWAASTIGTGIDDYGESLPPLSPPRKAGETLLEWAKHDESWASFHSAPPRWVTVANVPWPPHKEAVLDFYEKLQAPGQRRKAYGIACRRWHPDKFMQQFGALVLPEDLIELTSRVNDVFQAVSSQWEVSRAESQ